MDYLLIDPCRHQHEEGQAKGVDVTGCERIEAEMISQS